MSTSGGPAPAPLANPTFTGTVTMPEGTSFSTSTGNLEAGPSSYVQSARGTEWESAWSLDQNNTTASLPTTSVVVIDTTGATAGTFTLQLTILSTTFSVASFAFNVGAAAMQTTLTDGTHGPGGGPGGFIAGGVTVFGPSTGPGVYVIWFAPNAPAGSYGTNIATVASNFTGLTGGANTNNTQNVVVLSTGSATGGTFTLSVAGFTTTVAQNFNVSASALQSALNDGTHGPTKTQVFQGPGTGPGTYLMTLPANPAVTLTSSLTGGQSQYAVCASTNGSPGLMDQVIAKPAAGNTNVLLAPGLNVVGPLGANYIGWFFITKAAGTMTFIPVNGLINGRPSLTMPGGESWYVWFDLTNWWVLMGSLGPTNTSTSATASTPAPVTGTAFTPAANSDCELSFAVATAGTFTVTMGPLTGAENTVLASTALPVGAFISKRIPANWKVVITGTIASLENILAVTC